MARSYSCWLIPETIRDDLLDRFPPVFPKVKAHHVTHIFGSEEMPPAAEIKITGRYVDPTGIDVLTVVVVIDGVLHTHKPNGEPYHITWSLAEGRSANHSNHAIANMDLQHFMAMLAVNRFQGEPAVVPRN